MNNKREKITPVGESILCQVFSVKESDYVSKDALKIHILKQRNLINELTQCLFNENANHPVFKKMDESSLNLLRKNKFKEG